MPSENKGEYDLEAPKLSKERPPNPVKTASIFSQAVFSWPYKLLSIGMKRHIEEIDLPFIPLEESSRHNLDFMTHLWEKELHRTSIQNAKSREKRRPNLHRALLLDYLSSLWYIQPMMGIASAAKIGQGVALGYLIEYFSAGSHSREGYLWCGVLIVCAVIVLFTRHHIYFHTWRKGSQLRIATVASIFSKSLRLPSVGGTGTTSSGQIVNMASNDVERFMYTTMFISYLWWGPIEALAVFVFGWFIVGPAIISGYALLFIFVPLQYHLSQRFAVLRSKIAACTDARVSLISQVVSGIRVVKMSAWEKQFQKRITKLRQREMAKIQEANRLKAFNEAIFFASSMAICITIYVVHVFTGGVLTTRMVFSTMTLINVVQTTMTKFFSFGVMFVSECTVSVHRIQSFFELPELIPSLQPEISTPNKIASSTCTTTAVSMKNATCYWDTEFVCQQKDDDTDRKSIANQSSGSIMALSNISIEFHLGKLYCVIGPVGCGKTAFLLAVAGELAASEGSITRNYTSLAYASQDPWIMDGTIRENILMGCSYDDQWYKEVVAACGLTHDFNQFQNGDGTIVGDRGVQCSGGQRARVGLARALYRNSEVLLLDDPMSAVDSRVGRLIFFKAIMGLAVKRGKCVILATHQHQFISDSQCVLMQKGGVKCIGTYSECVEASEGDINATLQVIDDEDDHVDSVPVEKASDTDEGTDEGTEVTTASSAEFEEIQIEEESNNNNQNSSSSVHKESSKVGIVTLSTWIAYGKAMGGVWVAISVLVLFAITQATVLAAIAVIGQWASMPPTQQNSPRIIGTILGIGVAVVLTSILRSVVCFFLTLKASQRLHDGMTQTILRAKIEFFDTNPVGRILNRFSADVGINDDQLPLTLYDFLTCSLIVLGGIATAITVMPFILLAVPPLVLYFWRIRKIFVKTSRELKRYEGLARSPIFAMISESLSGIATIRSNNAQNYFKSKFEQTHDAHTRAFFAFLASNRWLGFRMDSIITVLVTASCLLAVLMYDRGWFDINPAILGLALTMLLQLSGMFQWAVRQSAEVVNQMVSVERVVSYNEIPSEAELHTDADSTHGDWPRQSSIEIKDLEVRYRADLPPSLSEFSCNIESGHRVGVVGRTGSGKSTLIQALFRLLQAEEGVITIDGVDISKLGLHKLRMNLSVIPQSPVLFSGCTVKENLDPFGKYDDDVIISALVDVQMQNAISELPDGLDSIVAEGGSNFSVGQRQLLCLARAILQKSKILVLDEPTANVDKQTDSLLQKAVAKSFASSTIIAVAHRLDTIIEYDRIMVLGNGQLLEVGAPNDLLERDGGTFDSMVNDTGRNTSFALRKQASLKCLA